MSRVRASEIGTFIFCARAWWYAGHGVDSRNTTALEGGAAWHRRHGRRVLAAGCLRTLGYLLILAATVVAVVYVTATAVP